jgi:hypothetical protein
MDLKTHILRWQRAIQENPAVLALVIFIGVAVIFMLALLLDAILRRRRDKKRLRK